MKLHPVATDVVDAAGEPGYRLTWVHRYRTSLFVGLLRKAGRHGSENRGLYDSRNSQVFEPEAYAAGQ